MNFDDGTLKIYRITDKAPSGNKPIKKLIYKASHSYGFETVGLTRINFALQNKSRAEELVHIWQDRSVAADQICTLDDGTQYKILFAQHMEDEDGLRITKLTLERLLVPYEIQQDI